MPPQDVLDKFIAHYNESHLSPPHPLSEHLTSVEKRAVAFSSPFDPSGLASIVALSHDIGKSHPDFQDYIQKPDARRGSVKHALPGAYLLSLNRNFLPPTHLMIAYLLENMIAGHHRGLYDMDHVFLKRYNRLSDEGFTSEVKEFVSKQARKLHRIPAPSEWQDPVFCAALTRFIFSAVVDADWLDTEAYFNKELAFERVYKAPSFSVFQKEFHAFTNTFPQNKLTEYREFSERKGKESLTFFELALPTGFGKTYASLAFALEHAKRFEKSRIVVALPLINLTAEIGELYRDLFGDEHVIEDHSAFRSESYYGTEDSKSRLHLATENWDRPFIVTTTVQLFESLFSNQPAKLRKIHRLAGSVLILDEYHLLPAHLLPTILKMLDVLQEHFNVTVLLVSATPLPITTTKAIHNLQLKHQPQPIVEPIEAPHRVRYTVFGQVNEDSLLDKLTDDSTLIIVNTRKHAQQLYRLAIERYTERPVYHLSTALTAKDRAKRVLEIKHAVKNRPIVISTQILEAGVDVSFQCVYREMAPLPSIIQAAGRCNRYNEQALGQVYLFSWPTATYPSESYRSGVNQLKRLLHDHGTSVFYTPEALTSYYRRFLDQEVKKSLIEEKDTFQFETVASKFKMIDSHGITVLCPQASGFQKHWLKEVKTRTWRRKVQPYTAQAPESAKAWISEEEGIPVWTGPYDDEIGILLL